MPELLLSGCDAVTLLGYLKALGVHRIASLQIDEDARGRWHEGAFELRVDADADRLESFLIEDYAPAPVVSPWNGGSGFHPKDRDEELLKLEHSTEARFAAFRSAISCARHALEDLGLKDKPEKSEKPRLIRELRRRLPDDALAWLDAATVIIGDRVAYPPILGTGGNDGRFDFANNYAQCVVDCLISSSPERSRAQLSAALFGGAVDLQRKRSLGHLSRDASPNNSPYGMADSLGNPWDLILAVEGSLMLVAGAARRLGAAAGGALAAPFTVRPTAAGYGSAVDGESGRDELWLPLWSGWASRAELETLIRESRAMVGRGPRRRQASSGLDYAIAAGSLGVASGITGFQRIALLERAGESGLAVPIGTVSVSERPAAAEAIQTIDRWLRDALRRTSDDHGRAARIAARRLERASFTLASRGGSDDACALLEAMGEAEHAHARSSSVIGAAGARPLGAAAAGAWIAAADDRSPEFAAACAIAALPAPRRGAPAVRDYLHGTASQPGGGTAFDAERRHLVSAGSPTGLLAAIHARRLRCLAAAIKREEGDASAPFAGEGTAPGRQTAAHSAHRLACHISVARAMAAGALDERRVIRLLRGLALLDYRGAVPAPTAKVAGSAALPAYDILALVWMGNQLKFLPRESREMLGPRPDWAARLAAGAVHSVIAECILRLTMAGLAPIATARDFATLALSPTEGRRLCAALLIPVRSSDVESIARQLLLSLPPSPEPVVNDKIRKDAA
ncbi:MAG TPA: type I-U CRISPR-associated protein Csx17 [Solirubrobacteraceae bacterium]|nr:type I-U CRISPR-associated protein Csx17 [Solirubrobacteraceae bacterium]